MARHLGVTTPDDSASPPVSGAGQKNSSHAILRQRARDCQILRARGDDARISKCNRNVHVHTTLRMQQSLRLIELITCVMSSYPQLKQTTAACRPNPSSVPTPEQCKCGAPSCMHSPLPRRQSGQHRHRRLNPPVTPSEPPPPPL